MDVSCQAIRAYQFPNDRFVSSIGGKDDALDLYTRTHRLSLSSHFPLECLFIDRHLKRLCLCIAFGR
jgi:hypothetical protein